MRNIICKKRELERLLNSFLLYILFSQTDLLQSHTIFIQPELSLRLRKIKHLKVYLNNHRVTFLLVHFTYTSEKEILSQLEKVFSTADLCL